MREWHSDYSISKYFSQAVHADLWTQLQTSLRKGNPMNVLSKFIKSESGATAIEYGLIAAGIAAAIAAIVTTIGTDVNTAFTTIADAL